MVCKILGYYTSNDGGESEYIISSTPSSAYYVSLNNGLYANFIIPSKIVPEMFGAKGDGISNDSSAFELAFKISNTLHLNEKSYFLGENQINLSNKQSIEIIGKNRKSTLINGSFLININSDWSKDKDNNRTTQPAFPIHISGVRWNKNHSEFPAIICAVPILFENCQIFYYKKFIAFPNSCYIDRVNFLECNFYLDEQDYSSGSLIVGIDSINNYSDWIGNGDDWLFKNCSFTPLYNQTPIAHISHGNHSVTFENCINPCVCFGSDSNYKDLPQIYFNSCHFENTYNACFPKSGYNNQKALVNYNNCYFHAYSIFNLDDIFTGLSYFTGKTESFIPNTIVGLDQYSLDKFNGVIVPFASQFKHKKDYYTKFIIPNTKSIGISSQTAPDRLRVTPISASMDYVFYFSNNPYSYDISTKIFKENVSPNSNNFNLWYVNTSDNTNFFLHVFRKNNTTNLVQHCVMYVGFSWCVNSSYYLFQDGGNSIEGIYKWYNFDGDFPS